MKKGPRSAAAPPADAKQPVDRIAVFAALQWECRAVLSQLRGVHRMRVGGFRAWRGAAPRHDVWVVKTGVGLQRAAAAASALGDPGRFARIISTGCAGGLVGELETGDLVVATATRCDGGAPAASDAALRLRAVRAAAAARLRCTEGPTACRATALATTVDKRAAARDGCIAVDMESASIAAYAAAAAVPFLAIRTVLDGVDDELPASPPLLDATTGRVRPLALVAHLAGHPATLAQLLALQRMQRVSRSSLERFFAAWLADDGR